MYKDNKNNINAESASLHHTVKHVVNNYLRQLDGRTVINIYEMVLNEIEPPLLETVMKYAKGNQSKASIALGISSGTLRKKLKHYDLDELDFQDKND